jgi:hypothetical protein
MIFQFAVLVSCCNPVTGTPTTSAPKPAPKPTPAPMPTPTPKPTPPPKPTSKAALVCSWLRADQGTTESNGDRNYTLAAQAVRYNGATISGYKFVFGDGKSTTINTSSTSASASHLYAPGTWHAYVTINSGNSPDDTCTATVTVNRPGTPPPTPTVPISTVKPTPTPVQAQTVAALPNTGPGAVVIIAIASVIGGYVFHMGHRHIRNKRRTTHHHNTHHHPHRPAHAH